jgi:hypothetical protein
MTGTSTQPARAGAEWLRLRESADARARSTSLVSRVRGLLADGRALIVHDLGAGSGSMARWLAPQLRGPQHWVLHDRDDELLALATAHPPRTARDGAPVRLETRCDDITRLPAEALADADLITASALLDMMTADELDRFVVGCVAARCPVLVALSVTGEVRFRPSEPLDARVREAFNAHQQRRTPEGWLLGPAAAGRAVQAFRRHGALVAVRPTPWVLGADQGAMIREWLAGWWAAACEQEPDLAGHRDYLPRRLAQLRAGRLVVTVPHADLLAWPR